MVKKKPTVETQKIIVNKTKDELIKSFTDAEKDCLMGCQIYQKNETSCVMTVEKERVEEVDKILEIKKVTSKKIRKLEPSINFRAKGEQNKNEMVKSLMGNRRVFSEENDIVSLFVVPTRQADTNTKVNYTSYVVTIKPEAMERLVNNEMCLFINFERIKTYLNLRPKRCLNCKMYGHSTAKCRNEERKSDKKCYHCEEGADHKTFDYTCGKYIEEVIQLVNRTCLIGEGCERLIAKEIERLRNFTPRD